jgi:hypothetical protein
MKKPRLSRLVERLVWTLVPLLLAISLSIARISLGESSEPSEYDRYVRSFINQPPHGNWTYVEKPVFPVYFNESTIAVGSNWTIVSPLTVNHTYHVYAYGEWVNQKSDPSTDYDIYVYNPLGELEGYHTESAGLPEHMGTTVDEPFYTPTHSGNYSFVLRNDPRESNASKQATFMMIENMQTNEWHQAYLKGKENDLPVFNTSWAYEFVTDSQRIEVHVRVPDNLDMYEARLYLMANPNAGKGESLNDVPLAWEKGLYGEISQIYGGYNLESKEHRGIAYASCENFGQDLLLNYTTPIKGKSLYHLVFIAEKGEGEIDFLVKTGFGQAGLNPANPPLRTYPSNATTLTFVSAMTDLKSAALNYSTNRWQNSTSLEMQLTNDRTCTGTIPGQAAGTTVSYEARATDVLENTLIYRGNYSVKYASHLNLTLKNKEISIGQNITLAGHITPPLENLTMSLVFASENGTVRQTVYTVEEGIFVGSFKPAKEGTWLVQAVFSGDNATYPCSSESLQSKVGPPSFLSQYSTYIFAGVGGGAGTVAVAVVYIKKRKG